MNQKIGLQNFSRIKTEKCLIPQCPIYQMFSNQIRAKHYKLVFNNDKYCFNCFGYHTEHDKRRDPFSKSNSEDQKSLQYEAEYFIDFSKMKKEQAKPKQRDNTLKQNNKNKTQKQKVYPVLSGEQDYQKKCYNYAQYVYHPAIYKTIKCPLGNEKQNKSTNSNCNNLYCPFLHQGQVINKQFQRFLNQYRNHNKTTNNHQKIEKDKHIFNSKLNDLIAIKSITSLELTQGKNNIDINRQQMNHQTKVSLEKMSTNNQVLIEDIDFINAFKLKLKNKVIEYLNVDKTKQKQQQSRRNVGKKGTWKQKKQSTPAAQTKNAKQKSKMENEQSYNYFNYGQKLPLIEGRTIQFKHFKDISDPNHIPLIMKYISAFLNTQGGKMYIGIDDNSYVYGAKFKQTQYDKLLLNIDREGKFSMNPPLLPQKYQIKLIPVYHDKKGGQQRWVIQITVFPPPINNKKLFLYNRECYMRMNASTHKLNASDLIQFFRLNPNIQNPNSFGDFIIEQKHSQIVQKRQNQRLSSHKLEQNKGQKRQNKLMRNNQKGSLQKNDVSKSKFQTQQSKANQFGQVLAKKSIQQLYSLRKDYQTKLNIIIQTYKRRQRQTR